ncbi:methyl-accepting chemotaxis protein [Domibacillus indicus]|uniref:methyl-accepting chemotaxis protein n=1 Tax=Domibacillus indicus TaxID=1437523 RepID=UPI00069816B3|nr:methyl-accepting chemotaxis protein [Domibacillus indicus]
MNMKLSIDQLVADSEKTVEAWSKDVTAEDAARLLESKKRDSETGQELEAHFNDLSEYQPQVAQGYIFGAELESGTDTRYVSGPAALTDALAEAGVETGGFYTQPDNIVKVIEEMKQTKTMAASEPYTDDFGTWVTVVKPYVNENGEVFAYYGVDFDAKPYLDNQRKMLWIVGSILLVLLLVFSFWQYKSVTKTFKPIQELIYGIEEATKGNFDFELKESKNELGVVVGKFNKMTRNIGGLLQSIKGASHETNIRSESLFSSIHSTGNSLTEITGEVADMSERLQSQTTSTAEALYSLEEWSQVVETVARNTSAVSELAADMETRASNGNYSVSSVQERMTLINESTRNSENSISMLKKRSEEISGIVELITSIADQTNLLSLNAAIEAARAGEQGKGFAVVAEEVRKLAEQSKQSAEQIKGLIAYIQKETDDAFNSINNNAAYVNEGVKAVEETGAIFADILAATQEVTASIQEVSSAAEEMAAENSDIILTFKQLSELARQNNQTTMAISGNIEQQHKSFENIIGTAQEMTDVVSDLEKVVSELNA